MGWVQKPTYSVRITLPSFAYSHYINCCVSPWWRIAEATILKATTVVLAYS